MLSDQRHRSLQRASAVATPEAAPPPSKTGPPASQASARDNPAAASPGSQVADAQQNPWPGLAKLSCSRVLRGNTENLMTALTFSHMLWHSSAYPKRPT